jgi:alkylresorcinol/alkylpyrone synthase
VIEAMADALDIAPGRLASSARVLASVGNLSSASVLHVLRDVIDHGTPLDGALGLLGAMGPGFAAELAAVRWRAPAPG